MTERKGERRKKERGKKKAENGQIALPFSFSFLVFWKGRKGG